MMPDRDMPAGGEGVIGVGAQPCAVEGARGHAALHPRSKPILTMFPITTEGPVFVMALAARRANDEAEPSETDTVIREGSVVASASSTTRENLNHERE